MPSPIICNQWIYICGDKTTAHHLVSWDLLGNSKQKWHLCLGIDKSIGDSYNTEEIARWSEKHLARGSYIVSDGLPCFRAVKDSGREHEAIVTGGGPGSVELEALTRINTMIGNVKNSIHSSYHAINVKHLPRYLAEFCYRFNRRF
jgi:hypothetical protein